MKWWATVAIVVACVSVADAAEPRPVPTIALQLRNDAEVPADVLGAAQVEVVRIFADAGLEVRWTDRSPSFTVTIVAQVLGYSRAASQVMGVAQRTAGGPAVQVFFKQVQHFARTYRIELSTTLAHVIAHEIGHLLLPGRPHSSTGLMQTAWDNAFARNVVKGSLTFTEAEALTIQASR